MPLNYLVITLAREVEGLGREPELEQGVFLGVFMPISVPEVLDKAQDARPCSKKAYRYTMQWGKRARSTPV